MRLQSASRAPGAQLACAGRPNGDCECRNGINVLPQHGWRRVTGSLLVTIAILSWPSTAVAQDRGRPSFIREVTRRVVSDPTTYAPSIVKYDSAMRDWKSSQPFFRNGFVEHNGRFTVSGLPDSRAVSYGTGRATIAKDALTTLGLSVANNAASSVVERLFIQRYPSHRKLIRTLGWIERISVVSYRSYRLSARHYRQWQENERLSKQLGLQ